eukprot:6369420-Amphidinium_carterae.1
MPPPGLGTPLPSQGLLQQTPSAAVASPVIPRLNFSKLSGTGSGVGASCPRPGQTPGQGYESFGEPQNNLSIGRGILILKVHTSSKRF